MAKYKQIEKVLDLALKTGDKVIVLSDSHDPYVLMGIKDYEALIFGSTSLKDLSENELLDKINRDIAVWKASQDSLDAYNLDDFKADDLMKIEPEDSQKSDNLPSLESKEIKTEEDNRYYIEPVD
ncbi:MAG: hypothetical protein PHO91_00370 [Patescibacteria group bacterium]|nr:hypothetical protein [Patescibacteria group bacterium]